MKKITALVLACIITLLCLSACAKTQPDNNTVNDSIPTTAPQEMSLSCDALIGLAENWAKEKGITYDFVTDIERKPGEAAGETKTTFLFYGTLASATVSEMNELVQTVTTLSLTSKIAEGFPSNTSTQNSQYAYVVCMELLKLCESDKDLEWHETQLKAAPEEGDETMVMRSYTSDDWQYVIMISELWATCVAARYCKQCNTNAPKVTFSSDTGACDGCNSNSVHNEEATTPTQDNVPEESTTAPQSKTLKDILDISKVWKVSFKRTGYIGTFHYAFSKDGTFYILLSDGGSPWDGGKGTYQINGNTIRFSLGFHNSRFEYSYDFDPSTYTLTQTSGTAIYSDFTAGTKHLLEVDDSNTVSKIQAMAQSFMGSANDSEKDPSQCSHTYADATCTAPPTCTKCGTKTGYPINHTWEFTSCTTEMACPGCGMTMFGSAPGHKWKAATCTEPECCTVCNKTGAAASGHRMVFTKCQNSSCSYTDYSCIAGTYTNAGGYGVPVGTTTMVDLNITNVSVSDSGVLRFTCNGSTYTLTLKQNNRGDSYSAYFNCYLNGALVENVDFRANRESRIHLDAFIIDGCKIYLNASR